MTPVLAILLVLSLCMVSESFGVETWMTQTLSVQSPFNDAYSRTDTGEMFPASSHGYMGKGIINGWRFENVSIPHGAVILNASLEIYSDEAPAGQIRIRYTGEAVELAEPFSPSGSDLLSRTRCGASVEHSPGSWIQSGWNSSPDLAPVIQEIVNLGGWRAGSPLVLFAEDDGSDGVRGIRMFEGGENVGALLNVTYNSGSCEFDTDGDGVVDISIPDWDCDGYCEFAVGKTVFPGVLVIDRPVEIMGYPATRTETILKGDGLILTENGKLISDLTSPVISSAYGELKGNDLYVAARNFIRIDKNAEILLGGDEEGYWSGDIYFETLRPGNRIIIEEGAALYGRKIRMISYEEGEIQILGGSRLIGRSHLRFQTYKGDIEVDNAQLSTSSPGGKCHITWTITREGDVCLGENVSIAADVIDFCAVQGEVIGGEGALVTGRVECR
jgi:hypothetical protein